MRFLLIACLITPPLVAQDSLRVSAAASLTDVLHEIAAQYGQPVLFNFGASSMLARQIQEGAPADLFISADELKMDQLAQRGLVVKKSRVDILANTLATGMQTVTIDRPLVNAVVGQAIDLFAGYDGSREQRDTKFGDNEGFEGMPFMPTTNPSIVAADIKTPTGGKK